MDGKLTWWGVDDLRLPNISLLGGDEGGGGEGKNGSRRERREEEEQAIRENMADRFQSRGVASTGEGGTKLSFLEKYYEIQVRVSSNEVHS